MYEPWGDMRLYGSDIKNAGALNRAYFVVETIG